MKEIKIRYIFKHKITGEIKKEIYTIENFELYGLSTFLFFDVNWELTSRDAYIGLKDKHGNEIYKGDIVKTQPFRDKAYSNKVKTKQHIGIVEYNIKQSCGLRYGAEWIINIKDLGKFTHCDWGKFFNCEVIGNVYENPELLNQKE